MAKFTVQGSNLGREGDYVGTDGSWTGHRRIVIEANCFFDALLKARFGDNVIFIANSPHNTATKREYKTIWNEYTFVVEKVE